VAVDSISKRLRFEIFKRDHFTCSYCGRTPPAVILHVDHIDPRALGGLTEPSNLITACSDCNLGKSDKSLGDVIPPVLASHAEELQEKVEQMREYRAWRAEYDNELRYELNQIWQAWCDEFGGYYDEKEGVYHAGSVNFPSERTLLEQLESTPTQEILNAIRATGRRYHARGSDLARSGVAPYFYAVMRSMARQADEKRRGVTTTWEELVSLLPELGSIAFEVADFTPADPWHFCGTNMWASGWNNVRDGYKQPVAPPTERIAALVGPKSANIRDPLLGTQTAYDLAVRTIRAMVPACGQTCECGRPKRPILEEDYPRCMSCGQITEPVDRREGCVPTFVTWHGVEYKSVGYSWEPSIRQCKIAENYGRYRRLKERDGDPKAYARCQGCNTPFAGYHHPGCRNAACPVCWEPAGSCVKRGHSAPPLERSIKQALASMKKMGRRQPVVES
jgi:hypothetical protein